ncbi:hypothetical protein PLICRDRAFT_458231 [Plicaturopsis crispa FD-325 SS-3]|nr:hypothetical protein PLICRDRAFT_458231 [Plicaturopsis crispa FD-325 SS-3]
MLPSTSSVDCPILPRSLTSADIPKVRELHSKVLPQTYPASFFRQFLYHSDRVCLLISHSQPRYPCHPHRPPVLAFITAAITHRSYSGSEPRIEILTLGVDPTYRRQGLAGLLVGAVIQEAQMRVGMFADSKGESQGIMLAACTPSSNIAARQFYARLGLKIEAVVHRLYHTLGDGVSLAGMVS